LSEIVNTKNCVRCGYTWQGKLYYTKDGNLIRQKSCPKCKSYDWDVPRKRKRGRPKKVVSTT